MCKHFCVQTGILGQLFNGAAFVAIAVGNHGFEYLVRILPRRIQLELTGKCGVEFRRHSRQGRRFYTVHPLSLQSVDLCLRNNNQMIRSVKSTRIGSRNGCESSRLVSESCS
ncbi:hypothetical protein D3C75_645980 [compost metagenome]